MASVAATLGSACNMVRLEGLSAARCATSCFELHLQRAACYDGASCCERPICGGTPVGAARARHVVGWQLSWCWVCEQYTGNELHAAWSPGVTETSTGQAHGTVFVVGLAALGMDGGRRSCDGAVRRREHGCVGGACVPGSRVVCFVQVRLVLWRKVGTCVGEAWEVACPLCVVCWQHAMAPLFFCGKVYR